AASLRAGLVGVDSCRDLARTDLARLQGGCNLAAHLGQGERDAAVSHPGDAARCAARGSEASALAGHFGAPADSGNVANWESTPGAEFRGGGIGPARTRLVP